MTEQRKHEILARSWLMLLPSLKEGWGIVIGEAGSHGVPTVAYASAGGTRESIADGVSGLLVDNRAELTEAAAGSWVTTRSASASGKGAREMSHTFSWEHSQESFAHVLTDVLAGRRVAWRTPTAPDRALIDADRLHASERDETPPASRGRDEELVEQVSLGMVPEGPTRRPAGWCRSP